MEKQQNRYILFYSIKDDKFTSFLPLDLENKSDKSLLDFLSDSNNTNFINDKVFKLPLKQNVYKFLFDLEGINFEIINVFDFFKKYNLEEWNL